MMKVEFKCDLCGRTIVPPPLKDSQQQQLGHGLRWTGSQAPLPLRGDKLVAGECWQRCPIHICEVCTVAISAFVADNQ